jgi:hypothetical protein
VNTNLSKAWEQYFKRFEYYLKATGVTKDEQKRALLLHVAGEELQDIIEQIVEFNHSFEYRNLIHF